jgi:hypothetical protein
MAGTQRVSPNRRNIRLGELHTQRLALEEQLRPLRLQIIDLINQEMLAHSRAEEDARRLRVARDAADDLGPNSATEINLRQSNLAIALREAAYIIKQNYTNNTANSEASRRYVARVARLQERLRKKRNEAYSALAEQSERAQREYTASLNTYNSMYRPLGRLILQRTILEDALRAIVDEEAILNSGRGQKRQHRATYKRGKKGKNTRKKDYKNYKTKLENIILV